MRLNGLILILAAATLACRASGRLTPTSPPSATPTSVPATLALAATPTGPPSTPTQPSPTPPAVDTPTSAPVVPPTEAASPTPEAIAVTPGTFDVTYQSNGLDLPATLCVPDLPGPLPAVVYNHGGLGDKIGGAPAETCAALAQAGYVGFSPIRRQTVQMEGHLDDVMAAIDYVLALEYVDGSRLGVMGFSRGGFLTFAAATRRPDFAAVVIMAPAPARGPYAGSLSQGSNITAPVLFLVAENDTVQADHIASTQSYYDAIASGGNQPELIVYPPYGNDGHYMFFEIGAYWADVVRFLDANLAIQSY